MPTEAMSIHEEILANLEEALGVISLHRAPLYCCAVIGKYFGEAQEFALIDEPRHYRFALLQVAALAIASIEAQLVEEAHMKEAESQS